MSHGHRGGCGSVAEETILHKTSVNLNIETGQVHVWTVPLDLTPTRFLNLSLSSDERDRAERFVFENDRRRFVTCRGLLRDLLARYLGADPAGLTFYYGPKGKPFLAAPFDRIDLRFNLAHSEDLAIFAFTRGAAVGVDVERVRDIPDMADLAERVFSAREKAAYGALPDNEKRTAFFRGWTRKEAFIKALGDGLSFPLDGFEVSPGPGSPARSISIDGDETEARRWSVRDLSPAPGFVGAIAVKNRIFDMRHRQLSMRSQ